MRSRLSVVLAAVLALAGCAAPEAGQVISKRYEPAHSWTEVTCAFRHKNGTCQAYTTVAHNEPERWVLTLRDGDRQGDREVYRLAYERCTTGAHYPSCAETESTYGQ